MISLVRFILSFFLDILPSSCYGWRRFILKLMGAKVHSTTRINAGFRLYGSGKLEIGRQTWIGRNCRFYTIGNSCIRIGEGCQVGPETILNCQSHHLGGSRSRAGDCIIQDINIGSGCWIGTRSTILCQEIGSGSVVGAGSLVLNTVPSNAMVAGAPATVKKHYKPD